MNELIVSAIENGGIAAIAMMVIAGLFLYVVKALIQEIRDARERRDENDEKTREVLSALKDSIDRSNRYHDRMRDE